MPKGFSSKKGGYPAKNSKSRIPNAHQSLSNPWPFDWMISGHRYSGVPHSVHVLSLTTLAKPKSVILMWPPLSSSRFSGLLQVTRQVSTKPQHTKQDMLPKKKD